MIGTGPPTATGLEFTQADIEQSLDARFRQIVASVPSRPAVRIGSLLWTYRELDRFADSVAKALTTPPSGRRAAGGEERPSGHRAGARRVALLFRHGAPMVAAVIGTLRACAAYVPLDAAYPVERLAHMLAVSGADTIVTDTAGAQLAGRLAGSQPVFLFEDVVALAERSREWRSPASLSAPTADSLAYVLFTSGSTGTPKAVMQSHRNVLHHTRVWAAGLGIRVSDRLSLQSAYSWDSAVQDMFGALLTGACLHPVDVKAIGVGGVVDRLLQEQITVYHSTLPLFRAVARVLVERQIIPAVRMLALGGDHVLGTDLVLYRQAFAADCRLANAYGATECSCALLHVVDRSYRPPGTVVPLGTPVEHTSVYLVGSDGLPVEGAGEGEILVRSPHLALRPADRRDDDAADSEVHRTGDLARRSADGTLFLLGRTDLMTKISGIRVEIGEIEGTLREVPGVRDAVVGTYQDATGERQLVAYLVPEPPIPGADGTVSADTRPLAVDQIRAHLRKTLADHLVPTTFRYLDALPLTANNKIDRAALPAPTGERPSLGTGYAPPRSDPERAIARIWREVLGLAAVGIDDNFFDLGGTSLRLATVHERIAREIDAAVRMVDLYRAPTVRALVGLVTARRGGDRNETGSPGRTPGDVVGASRSRAAARRGARGLAAERGAPTASDRKRTR